MKKFYLLIILLVTILVGCSDTSGKELYFSAVEKTQTINNSRSIITSSSDTVDSEGEVLIDKSSNKVYYTGTTVENPYETTEFLYDNGTIYIYDVNFDKYILIQQDNPMSKFISQTLLSSTSTTFNKHEKDLIEQLDNDAFITKDINYILDAEKQSVTKMDITMPSDIAGPVFKASMLETINASLDYHVEMYTQIQSNLGNEVGVELTSEELERNKNEYRSLIEKDIETQFNNIKIEDIKYSIIIDKENIIRRIEEEFTIISPTHEPKTSSTVIEMIEYGDIEIPEIDESKIISYEEALELNY